MMNDERAPKPVTVTTTTTTTSPAYSLDWIKLDIEYFKSTPGILKLVQLFLGILCMALGSPALYSFGGTNFFLFVVVMAFILTLIWVIVYLLTVRDALQFKIPWVVLEFYYTAGATALYFIAMIVEFSSVSPYYFIGKSSYEAAAAFALFNTLVYGFGTFLLWKDWKGTTTTTTTTTAQVA